MNDVMPAVKTEMLEMLKQFGGQANVITVPRAFVKFAGSLEAGMLLSQLLYWHDKMGRRIYKSDKEWAEELCLSKYAVRQARATLEKMGVIKTEVHRANGTPTLHYYLDEDGLVAKWTLWIRKVESAKSKDCTLRNRKITNRDYTESTTESGAQDAPTPSLEESEYSQADPVHTIKDSDMPAAPVPPPPPLPSPAATARANAEFDTMLSASRGMKPQARTSATANPREARKQFIAEFAPRLQHILAQREITPTTRAACGKLWDKGIDETRWNEFVQHAENGAGDQYRKPSADGKPPNAFWITNDFLEWRANDYPSLARRNAILVDEDVGKRVGEGEGIHKRLA